MNDAQKQFYNMLYEKNYNVLHRYALGHLSDPRDIEDSIQNTFLVAVEKIDKLMTHKNPDGWLMQTLKYKIGKIYEKKNRWRSRIITMADISADLSIEDLPDQVSFDDAIIERLFNDELEKLRDIITPREFDVLKSHYIDGEPYQQVADRLGLTKNLVYVTAHRAKRKLEDYLNKNSKE